MKLALRAEMLFASIFTETPFSTKQVNMPRYDEDLFDVLKL